MKKVDNIINTIWTELYFGKNGIDCFVTIILSETIHIGLSMRKVF